jgi:echinoderm microtubule-associated protein-like 6
MTSHCKGELWAEAWSGDRQRFVTGGDDKTVRLWDSTSYKQLNLHKMKEPVRGLDWHKEANGHIVVGDYRGKIYLFDSDLKLLDEAKTRFSKTKPRQEPFWIQDIKFSPDGKMVAFGAHGGASHVELWTVEGDKFGSGKVVNAGLTSALLSVDWSKDSDTLAVVSQAYELKFISSSGSNVAASATRDLFKDCKWASWSGKFGFPVQEIHQDVTYSNLNCVGLSPSNSLIVSGSDDQKVRLFTYPVTIPKQKCK